MANYVGGVATRYDFETGDFHSSITRAEQRVGLFSRRVNASLAGITPLSKLSLAGGLFGVGAAGILSQAININKKLAETADLAREVGLSFDRIQAFKFAALSGGVSESGFTSGMEKMAKLIEESARQETTIGKLFEANNLSLKDRHGQLLNINDVMAKGADLVKNAGSGAAKVQVAEMLGLSREWVRALEGGGAAFLKTADGAREAGAVIDSNIIARAEVFEKQWVAATTRWQLATKAAAAELLPDMVKLADLAISIAASVGKWLSDTAIADKLDRGVALSVRELEYAIDLARKRGSPVDPSWIAELERLRAAQAAANKEAALSLTIRPTGPKTILPSKDKEGLDSDPFTRTEDSVTKRIALLNAEVATIGLSNGAREKARVIAELEHAAVKANTAAGLENTQVTAEQREVIGKLADAYGAVKEKIEAANGPLAAWARQSADVKKNLEGIAVSGLDRMADELQAVVSGSKSAADAFKNMTDFILKELQRLLIKMALAAMLKAFIGGGADGGLVGMGGIGNGGGLLGSAFGGGTGFLHTPGGFSGAFPSPFKSGGLVNIARAPTITAFARGGAISGPGGPRSDSILAALSDGEFVVNAAATKKHRALLESINSGFNFNSMLPAFARGGPVGFSVPAMNDTPYIGKLGVHALGAMGGNEVNFIVQNNSSAQVRQEKRQNANGGFDLVAIIEDVVASRIGRGDSHINNVLQARYGLDPTRGMV